MYDLKSSLQNASQKPWFHSLISSYSSMVAPWPPLFRVKTVHAREGRPRRTARTGLVIPSLHPTSPGATHVGTATSRR